MNEPRELWSHSKVTVGGMHVKADIADAVGAVVLEFDIPPGCSPARLAARLRGVATMIEDAAREQREVRA